jgi:hypothetical protein
MPREQNFRDLRARRSRHRPRPLSRLAGRFLLRACGRCAPDGQPQPGPAARLLCSMPSSTETRRASFVRGSHDKGKATRKEQATRQRADADTTSPGDRPVPPGPAFLPSALAAGVVLVARADTERREAVARICSRPSRGWRLTPRRNRRCLSCRRRRPPCRENAPCPAARRFVPRNTTGDAFRRPCWRLQVVFDRWCVRRFILISER